MALASAGLTCAFIDLQSAPMPIYRYRCESCGAREEHLQKISEAPIEECSTCGGRLSKQMTSAAFHLKGGGWYKVVYASNTKGSDSGPSAAGGGSSAGSSSSSSDSGSSSKSSDSGSSGGSSSSGSSTSAP